MGPGGRALHPGPVHRHRDGPDGQRGAGLQFHILNAKNHGVTAQEMAETLTHAAFYAGWPKAWAAFRMAKEVYEG